MTSGGAAERVGGTRSPQRDDDPGAELERTSGRTPEPRTRAGVLPVPTLRAVLLLGLGVPLALLAVTGTGFALAAAAVDAAVLVLIGLDFLLAPPVRRLVVERTVSPVLGSGVAHPVRLQLSGPRPLRGELRDQLPSGPLARGQRQRFVLAPETPPGAGYAAELVYTLQPTVRGDLRLGPVHVRLEGPLGLCARQGIVPVWTPVRSHPDVAVLTAEALKLAAAREDQALRTLRRAGEGREFESLRDYRPGDDARSLDWKASARRGRPVVRLHEPERSQAVQLFLDLGRHMVGEAEGRRKLDHAVDAALRLAAVGLARGDRVGVTAFGRSVQVHLPPERGSGQLAVLVRALYRLEAALEESDLGAALDRTFARQHRRTLVVIFTDLLDAESARTLVQRTARLRPRHVPAIVSLSDPDLQRAAHAVPETEADAYLRQEAARLEHALDRTVADLRAAGARVVRASPRAFSAAAVNAYLEIKERGLL